MLKLEYSGILRSISWLLVHRFPTSPGHQQPWYRLCMINRPLSSIRNYFSNLPCVSAGKWQKREIYFLFPKINSAQGLMYEANDEYKLTHCGLVTPYGYITCQHWLKWWLVAWQHQAITWSNVNLSSERSRDIHSSEGNFTRNISTINH